METQLRPVVEVAKNYSEPSSTHVQGELARDRDTAYTLLRDAVDSMSWETTMEELKGSVHDTHHMVRVKHVNAKLLRRKQDILTLLDHVYGKTKEPLKDN